MHPSYVYPGPVVVVFLPHNDLGCVGTLELLHTDEELLAPSEFVASLETNSP